MDSYGKIKAKKIIRLQMLYAMITKINKKLMTTIYINHDKIDFKNTRNVFFVRLFWTSWECNILIILLKSFIWTLGTQRVISFLRQIVEHGGFYRTTDQAWVTIERIQFVGACNPPTDPGRKPLSHRLVLCQAELTLMSILVIQNGISLWGTGLMQWWEHSPSANVALVRVRPSVIWIFSCRKAPCLIFLPSLFSGSYVMYQSSMLTTLVPHL